MGACGILHIEAKSLEDPMACGLPDAPSFNKKKGVKLDGYGKWMVFLINNWLHHQNQSTYIHIIPFSDVVNVQVYGSSDPGTRTAQVYGAVTRGAAGARASPY